MERKRHPRLTYTVDLPGGQARLREMILYVSDQCQRDEFYGKVKLNKILWKADFSSFAERRVPVTGRPYQRLKAGPAPVEMPPILAELFQEDLAELARRELGSGYVEERIIPRRPAKLHFFSADDIRFVDASIKYYWNRSAAEVSEDSHGLAWQSRENLDPMPYESAFISDASISPDLLRKLKEHAEFYSLKSA